MHAEDVRRANRDTELGQHGMHPVPPAWWPDGEAPRQASPSPPRLHTEHIGPAHPGACIGDHHLRRTREHNDPDSATVFQPADDRDAALLSDMAEGINESLERLDELLARLVPVS